MPMMEVSLSDEAQQALEVFARKRMRAPDAQATVFILDALGLWESEAPPKPSTSTARRSHHKRPAAANGQGA